MAQLELVEICRDEKNKAIVNLHGEISVQHYTSPTLRLVPFNEQGLLFNLGSMMEST